MSIKKHIELIESVSSNTTNETIREGEDVDLFLKQNSAVEATNNLIAEAKRKADVRHEKHGDQYPQDHVGEYSKLIKGVGRVTIKAIKVPTLDKNGVVQKYQYRITIKIWQSRIPKKELIQRFEEAQEKADK